jgi:hypothetical protein
MSAVNINRGGEEDPLFEGGRWRARRAQLASSGPGRRRRARRRRARTACARQPQRRTTDLRRVVRRPTQAQAAGSVTESNESDEDQRAREVRRPRDAPAEPRDSRLGLPNSAAKLPAGLLLSVLLLSAAAAFGEVRRMFAEFRRRFVFAGTPQEDAQPAQQTRRVRVGGRGHFHVQAPRLPGAFAAVCAPSCC